MKDPIERADAIKAAEKLLEAEHGIWERVVIEDAVTALCGYLMDLPAAQPQRKSGAWIFEEHQDGHYHAKCDQCGTWFEENAYTMYWKYCPECGARMDGGEQEG